MVVNKLNLSLNEPFIRQAYAKQGDTGRVFNIEIDPTPSENGTLRIKRPDGVEVTADAIIEAGGDAYKGDLVTFDALEEVPLTKCEVTLEPVQDTSSGDPSPTNICPIVGRDEVSVTRAGYYHRLIPTTSYSVGELIDTNNGVSLWYMGAGKYKWQGTASSQSNITVDIEEFTTQPSTVETRKLRINNSQSQSNASIIFRNGNADADSFSLTPANRSISYVALADKVINRVVFRVNSGYSVDMEIIPEFVDTAEETSYTSVFPTTAKNLFLGEFLQGYWAFANGTWADSNTWIATPKIRCKPSTYYTASADAKMTRWQGFVWYDENGDYITTSHSQSNANIGLTKQSPPNAKFLVFNIGGYPNSSSTISVEDVTHFQIEEGQTATAYEPHKYAVYGGKVDLVSGKLTITHEIVDLGTLNFSAGFSGFYTTGLASTVKIPSSVANSGLLSDRFVVGNTANKDQMYIQISTNYLGWIVFLPSTTYASASDFKTAMNGSQLVYELATPTVIDLTPQQISTLLGDNNIFSDSGDVVEVSFTYDGMYAELPSSATSVVGRCIGDVELNGVSTMPFTLVVQKNNQA